MKKKIIFSGFMAAMLLGASANAAQQIASKKYVDDQNTAQTADILTTVNETLEDYSTTTQIANTYYNKTEIAAEIADAIDDVVAGDVAGKADKVGSAVENNLAGLDASGNLKDSGIAKADITTLQTTVATHTSDISEIKGDVSTLETTVATHTSDISEIKGDVSTLETTVATHTSDISEIKGDISTIETNITTLQTTAADTYSKEEVDTAIAAEEDAREAADTTLQTAINTKVTANTAITAGTGTKITYDAKGLVTSSTSAAVADITGLQGELDLKLPKPPTGCGTAHQCVLSVNGAGAPFWEIVTITGSES